MNVIKVSYLWTEQYETISNTVLFNLLKILSKKKITFTKPKNADILILGPYNLETLSNRYKNILTRRLKSKKIENFLDNFQKRIFFTINFILIIFFKNFTFRY